MIVYFAGAKEETKSEPFSDPRVAVGKDLSVMLTYYEFKGKLSKNRKAFLKGLDKDFLEYEKRKNVTSRNKNRRRSNSKKQRKTKSSKL